MWGLIVIHSKQVFHFNCVRFNEVPLYIPILYVIMYRYNFPYIIIIMYILTVCV